MKTYEEFINEGEEFNYMMLGRLQSDNEYFLGNGNGNEKNLWAGNIKDQIKEMKRLMKLVKAKPEWISMKDIANYEKSMFKKLKEKNKSNK